MKIRKLELKNFRGAREAIPLILETGQSALIYGDNGAGKSSFADAIEWFITDKIFRLDGEEVGTYGGVRNELCALTDECSVSIECVGGLGGTKKLQTVGDRQKPEIDTKATEIIEKLSKENLIIRNSQLVDFIIATKGERLVEISNLVGLEELIKTKATLTKAANDLKRLLRDRNFESQIASKKKLLLEKLNANISNRKQFYAAINAKIKPFELGIEVKDSLSLAQVIKLLKEGINEKEQKEQTTLELAENSLKEQFEKLADFESKLTEFSKGIAALKEEKKSLGQIKLSKLLEEAEKVLAIHENDDCPLCQKPIERAILIDLIKKRIADLKSVQEKFKLINELRESLYESLRSIYQAIKLRLTEIQNLGISNIDISHALEGQKALEPLGKELKKDTLEIEITSLVFPKEKLQSIQNLATEINTELLKRRKSNTSQKIELLTTIAIAESTLTDIENMEAEKAIIDKQKEALEGIRDYFIALQRHETEILIKDIAEKVNEYFVFMNQGANVDGIKFSPVISNEEFVGIAIEFVFHKKTVASPKKFLSESYLNCIGLCLFLASLSVNKNANFFVLDDVISSFDKKHRIRFGQLLANKFSNYQILALTHESEWFEIFANEVRGKGWKIHKAKWNPETGISLDIPSISLLEKIQSKIDASEEDGLGNTLRIYTERLFKEMCCSLGARVYFQFNDNNENRMMSELLNYIKSRLAEKNPDLAKSDIITNLSTTNFIANTTSHDSSFKENIDDFKVIWQDLQKLDGLFRCGECKKLVNFKTFDSSSKEIHCGCSKRKAVNWKD